MEKSKVDMFIMTNQKYLPADKIMFLRQRMEQVDDDRLVLASSIEMKEPTTLLIVSLLIGGLGIDRFMLGDTGMGVLKLLTGGCCGILTIIDWFTITKKAKETNFNNLMMAL